MFRMRPLDLSDAKLAVPLILAVWIAAQQLRRFMLSAVGEVGRQYPVDPTPVLLVLVGVLGIQLYVRREAYGTARPAGTIAPFDGDRAAELENVVAFGRSVGGVLDLQALAETVRQYAPRIVPAAPRSIL
jgi:hypothetical protein